MTEKAKTLEFHRGSEAGVYSAEDDTRHYTVWREGRTWYLAVKKLTTTAGIRHAVGQPVIDTSSAATKALAVDIARRYSALGDDYAPHQHGHAERITTAILAAYGAEDGRLPGGHA